VITPRLQTSIETETRNIEEAELEETVKHCVSIRTEEKADMARPMGAAGAAGSAETADLEEVMLTMCFTVKLLGAPERSS
jgi:hypothetical protein